MCRGDLPGDRPAARVDCCLVFRGLSPGVGPFPQSETTSGLAVRYYKSDSMNKLRRRVWDHLRAPPEVEPLGSAGTRDASVCGDRHVALQSGCRKLPAPRAPASPHSAHMRRHQTRHPRRPAGVNHPHEAVSRFAQDRPRPQPVSSRALHCVAGWRAPEVPPIRVYCTNTLLCFLKTCDSAAVHTSPSGLVIFVFVVR